jgi:hypothetical protein
MTPPFTTSDYIAMKERTDRARLKGGTLSPMTAPRHGIDDLPPNPSPKALLERHLHEDIIRHCNQQWPRWKYIHARMDQKSTIQEGAQDFTIFMPGNRTLCVECKRPGEKPTAEQRAWAKEMEMLGHTVHVITTMEQFKALL